jgi:hypothetical protein
MNIMNEEFFLQKINKILPDELINIIKEYLPIESIIFLTKKNYISYHSFIRIRLIPKKNIENYIRDIIRRYNNFVFNMILEENYLKWLNIKHYIYKNIFYKNYIYFLKDFCIENESHKCRILINTFLFEHGLCQNQHKNNIHKNKRWKI